MKHIVHCFGLTDTGSVRTRNEDSWFADSERGLFIVSDGMGGHPAGDRASLLVVKVLPAILYDQLAELAGLEENQACRLLETTLRNLNDIIRLDGASHPEWAGMGATLTMALMHRQGALIGNLGDSRVYLYREGLLSALTRDHSVIQQLIDQGEVPPEEADQLPLRGQITRFIGMAGEARPDVRWIELRDGDRLLLCSDGLTAMLANATIGELLKANAAPETTARVLVEAANVLGGRDNVTVIIVDIGAVAPIPAEKPQNDGR